MQLVVAPLDVDRRLRTLKHAHVFTAVLRTVPTYAAWLDVLDPITPVFPMAGLHNTLRRLVVDGVPVATGLHALGDSVCTTNPTLGRGLSLALWGAADLADVLAGPGRDRAAPAPALDALVADHVAPFYEDQAAVDEARLARLRHTIFGAPAPALAPPAAVRGAAHGRAVRPDRVSRLLERHGDDAPSRRGLRRPAGGGGHARRPRTERGRAAAGPANH